MPATVSQNSSNLESTPPPSLSDNNPQPTLLIQAENGALYSDNISLNGTVWDDTFPTQLIWQLENQGDIVSQGSALNSLIENLTWPDPSTKSWSFNIQLNNSEITNCACTLTVAVIDSEQQITEEHLLLFINQDGTALPPHLIIIDPEMGIDWRGDMNIAGVAVSPVGYQPTLEWSAIRSNQANHFCNRGVLSQFISVESWNSNGISYSDSETFNIEIQSSQYDDGWWLFVVRAGDNSGNYSSTACTAIALHNQRPIAILSGTSEVNESELARFDASNSDDPVWGKDGLRFTFIMRIVGETNPPMVYDLGTEKSWNWYANQSGTFDVMVLVTDTSGLSNSTNITLIVNNIKPVATASIEGISFDTNEVIKLPDESIWTVDASASQDSENDLGGLSYVWYVDGEPVSLGREQIMRRVWIKDESRVHLITLSVTDDDGDSDFIEVLVGIEGTQSDPDWTEPLTLTESMISSVGGEMNMMFIFMVVLVLLSLITLKITRDSRESDIPKWIPKLSRENREDEAVDADFDNDELD
jgi:hypothetical protein